LNYSNKKREAERIDRENERILGRILSVKCNKNVDYDKLERDFKYGHMKNKKMIMDKNQGLYVEDMIEHKQRMKDSSALKEASFLPNQTPFKGSEKSYYPA
jgi:hypothetical protein